jgi:hypothetical protein
MSPKQGVRNPPSKEEGLQELKKSIESFELNLEISKTSEQIAVKYCLQLLHEKVPGNSVEVRIPPHAAVQVIAGIKHKRGTPPAVIEMDPKTWIYLAVGKTIWETAKSQGLISASGERADLSTVLPLLSAQDLAK